MASCSLSDASEGQCKALNDRERERLLQYVRARYKVPPALRLTLDEASFVEATCYRRLRFNSDRASRALPRELFLSPDLRFLTAELIDSTVDPILEERRRRRALAAGLNGGNFPSLGPRNAPVTITIFSDFQCPYCAQMARVLTQQVLPNEQRTTRLVFRHFPLKNHEWALIAAHAAACAQEQGDRYFWRMHDFIFEQQRGLGKDTIMARVTDEIRHFRGFDLDRFLGCFASKRAAPKIDMDVAFGTLHDVTGTPTIFVNGERIASVAVPEQIRTLIREALSRPVAAIKSSR